MTNTLTDSIIALASKRIAAGKRPLFESCTRRLLEGIESHPLGSTEMLAALAAESFEWIQQRQPDEILVRVSNPAGG